jgi:hypothetical protein
MFIRQVHYHLSLLSFSYFSSRILGLFGPGLALDHNPPILGSGIARSQVYLTMLGLLIEMRSLSLTLGMGWPQTVFL